MDFIHFISFHVEPLLITTRICWSVLSGLMLSSKTEKCEYFQNLNNFEAVS